MQIKIVNKDNNNKNVKYILLYILLYIIKKNKKKIGSVNAVSLQTTHISYIISSQYYKNKSTFKIHPSDVG